ncbi:serine protease [Bacilli bacterium]|nr:serine protease [Bacilli bacterium]
MSVESSELRVGGFIENEYETLKNDDTETKVNKETKETKKASVADIVEKVAPSVVSIKAVGTKQNYDEDYFVYSDQMEDPGAGSGFLIDGSGLILTNSHVVDYSDEITVKLDGKELKAELIGQDRLLDIAVLKINAGKKLNFLELKPIEGNRVGDSVIVIGNPHDFGLSVSTGVISAIKRNIKDDSVYRYNYIQTDASINPGNSGGPILNERGKVIGISTFIVSSGSEGHSLGFALPIDGYVIDIIKTLIKFGYRQNGYLGISGFTMDDRYNDYLKVLNSKRKTGVLVKNLYRDSPAEKGGIVLNDIIVSYDGRRVDDFNTLMNMIRDTSVGSRVEILVLRNEKYIKLRIQIEEDPRDVKYNATNQRIKNNSMEMLGMFMSQIDEELIEKYELYNRQNGMYILDVRDGDWADTNGIEKGDVLVALNQTQIKTKKDMVQFFDNMKLNGQKEFIVLIKKQRGKDNILVKANINLVNR